MNENIPIGMEGILNANSEEEAIDSFFDLIDKIYNVDVIMDSISTPIGQYIIETSEDPVHGGFSTILTVESSKNSRVFGPVCVSEYKTLEEAESEHRNWRSTIIETPPIIFRDIRKGSIIIINPQQ